MKKIFIYFLIILFFTGFSIFATYPLITKMEVAVKNLGDPVLNLWILNWDIHKFLTGLGNFFDANIFYPHTNTLTYSDHLIPQSLLALPVFLITREPIFSYNFLFLISFILSGLGMFFLVEHLTQNRLASLLAGFMFAFSPFRFGHLGHLQILTIQWLPFTFLFLHKFIETSRIRHLVFFSLLFIIQVLSCGYYALFLSLGIFIVFIFLLINRKINRQIIFLLVSAGIVVGILLFPFFHPYYKFRKEMGFKRPLSEVEFYSAQPQNYLATPTGNRLLGKLTERFVGDEAQLFPGITILIFAMLGIFKLPRDGVHPVRSPRPGRGSRHRRLTSNGVNRILEISIILVLVLILVLAKGNGFEFNFAFLKISLHSIRNPIYLLLFLIIFRWLNSQDKKKFLALDYQGDLYLILALTTFIFSLGPSLTIWDKDTGIDLPYLFLYNHLPGFQGLRVPARWGAFVSFSLIILAGFGLKIFFEALKNSKTILKWGGAISLFAFLISESIYIPIGYKELPKEVPPVYPWLAKEEGNFAILELPMPIDDSRAVYEAMYMYWSIYHWKSLVNGYSGFFPPDYWSINKTMQGFPSLEAIKVLQDLEIKYVIIHSDMMEEERIERIKGKIPEFSSSIRIANILGNDLVIEIFQR